MNEMIKRRKDNGFTLIELMIVIAVIGILAVVLVPKFGSIKISAKSTGVTTNFRSVAASVHAVKLNDGDDTEAEIARKVIDRLEKDFDEDSNNALVNPYTNRKTIINSHSENAAVCVGSYGFMTDKPDGKDDADYVGAVVVITDIINLIPTVTVYGCDDTGVLIDGLTEVIEL